LVLVRHCTQKPAVASQYGVGAAHCALDVHIGTHWCTAGSQASPVPQFALVKHATQAFLAVSQYGVAPLHWESEVQVTQVCVPGSQAG
jgi:hypothetical protein